jgi:hypothetical protein
MWVFINKPTETCFFLKYVFFLAGLNREIISKNDGEKATIIKCEYNENTEHIVS